MSLFGTPAKQKRMLIFHIGTHSVISALIAVGPQQKKQVPEIIFSHATPVPVLTQLSPTGLLSSMMGALKKSATHAVAQKIGSPDEIICFLEAPWYATQLRTISMSKTTPFTVTEKIINDLVKKETELFDREVITPSKGSTNEPILIEREISAILLNGYHVANPVGQKVKDLAITISLAISPLSVIDSIQDIIASEFHRGKIRFHTFGYAGATVTRDLFISHSEFMFVDVGGDMTEIVLIRDGVHSETISFPGGIHTLIRTVASSMQISQSDAQSLLSLYLSGRHEDKLGKKLARILAPAVAEWTSSLEKTLEIMASRFGLPHTIALLTEHAYVQLFTEAIRSETRAQYTLTGEPFSIIPLSDFPWRTYTTYTLPIHPRAAISTLLINRRYQ